MRESVFRMNTLAAEALFREYYTRLCHFAYQFTGDKEAAKDIAQEAFVNYLAQQERVSDHPVAIKNFLYSSIRNACLNAQRHEKVVKKFAEQKAAEPAVDASVVQAIIKSEVSGAIHQALQSLPEECQRIIRMGYIDGLKNKKIAELLDISINTVKTQKKRGLQLLRLRLPPELYTFFL
ncbi:RNA polymerase sigma-70 factor [Chitinophaga niabensis]|uniref:RNA polymerase sigma-70 factor, ECF subfamily n=1 Tax=Chitinophaga niabensis TaxID=536979 RepID=A0A1N6D333_9BACT|nr:RNA polymerase sigma-70 factor [Chitinophaga niabensis]SIN65116.1 RNA polymerase sigma-70 factor, ECF subfamily [Chitinophaga niabensis]